MSSEPVELVKEFLQTHKAIVLAYNSTLLLLRKGGIDVTEFDPAIKLRGYAKIWSFRGE
jgi:hypothetical protein